MTRKQARQVYVVGEERDPPVLRRVRQLQLRVELLLEDLRGVRGQLVDLVLEIEARGRR
jgi:hypothetical protein